MLVSKIKFLGFLLPWSLMFALSIVASLRGATTDTKSYYDLFYAIDSISLNPYQFYSDYGVEWFYGLLTVSLKTLGLGHIYLFFIFSLATFYFFYKTSKIINNNLTEILFYYISAYYIYQQLAFIRFGLATVLAYYLIYLSTKKNNDIIFLLAGALLVSLIHASAIFIIAIYILIKYFFLSKSIKKSTKVIISLLVLLSMRIFKDSLIALLGKISEKADFYANDDIWGTYLNLFSMENIKALILLILFTIFYNTHKKINQKSAFSLLLLLFAASVAVRFIFYDFGIISSRIGYALGFSEIFIIPLILKEITKNLFIRFSIAIIYFAIYRLSAQTVTFDILINDYLTPLI